MTDIEKWKEILTSYGVKTEESKYDAHVDEFNRSGFTWDEGIQLYLLRGEKLDSYYDIWIEFSTEGEFKSINSGP